MAREGLVESALVLPRVFENTLWAAVKAPFEFAKESFHILTERSTPLPLDILEKDMNALRLALQKNEKTDVVLQRALASHKNYIASL